MPRVILSEKAKTELLEIWLHIASENISSAENLTATIERKAALLAEHPVAGSLRPEIGEDIRSFDVGSGSYILFYQPIPNGIEAIHITHGARDIPPLLEN